MIFSPLLKIFDFFIALLDYLAHSVSHITSLGAVLVDVIGTLTDVATYIFPEELFSFVILGIVISILIRFFID